MGSVITVQVPTTPSSALPPTTSTPATPPADPKDSTKGPQDQKILGKFTSHKDLEAAYVELEKRLHGTSTDANDINDTVTPPADPASPTPAPTPTGKPNLNDKPSVEGLEEYEAEWAKTGALSEESYAKLAAMGHTKDAVGKYIEGRIAVQKANDAELFGVVGGADSFKKISAWSQTGMTVAERTAFNKAIDMGDQSIAQMAMRDLLSRYEAANGKTPNLLRGTSAGSGADAYRNDEEAFKAMRDPRYKTDTEYRDTVIARMAAMQA